MARGRMINQSISKSKKFNLALDNDFDRLLYCMLLPYADRDGRIEGDPDLVKGEVFPRRQDISEDDILQGLQNLSRVGLILYYQVDGDFFIEICQFQEGQEGFRYDREKPSRIPAPSGITPAVDGSIPTDDGENQEENALSDLEGHGGVTPTTAGSTPENADMTPPEIEIEREIEIEENSPLPPKGVESEELSVSDLLQSAQRHWNGLPNLPQCNRTMASFSEPGKMATIIRDVGLGEVKAAMSRLSQVWNTVEFRYKPKSFQRFILGNLEYWAGYETEETKERKSATGPAEDNYRQLSQEEELEADEYLEAGGIMEELKKRGRSYATA